MLNYPKPFLTKVVVKDLLCRVELEVEQTNHIHLLAANLSGIQIYQ